MNLQVPINSETETKRKFLPRSHHRTIFVWQYIKGIYECSAHLDKGKSKCHGTGMMLSSVRCPPPRNLDIRQNKNVCFTLVNFKWQTSKVIKLNLF